MEQPSIAIVVGDMPVCRICYEPCDTVGRCSCAGTTKYVHDECLKTWIRISQRTTCELCNAPFDVEAQEDEYLSQCINHAFYTSVNIMILIFLALIVVIFLFEIV